MASASFFVILLLLLFNSLPTAKKKMNCINRVNCYNSQYEHSCRRAEGWASGCRSRRGDEHCQCSPAPALRCNREWADNSLHQPAAKYAFALLPRPTHGYRQRPIDTRTITHSYLYKEMHALKGKVCRKGDCTS